MSSEWGLLGLARRTYSLDCPPDIPAVRLFRFMFRFRSKTVPERGRRALLSHRGTIISYLAALERYSRCRSGERSVALQELPENAGYSLVRLL